MPMSQFLSDQLIEVLFAGTGSVSAVITSHIGLFTTMPTCETNGTEVTGSGYARKPVATSEWSQNPANGSKVQNTAAITFAAPAGSWGTIIGVGIFKSLAGVASTDLLFWGTLDPALVITTGSVPVTFLPGQIQLDLCCC